jgi:hypothetical protein
VHVATHLQLRGAAHGVRGAVLLSGLYGATPLEGPDSLYYGTDKSLYPKRFPLKGLIESGVPLLIACAEFDPPRFQAEWRQLLEALQEKRGALPRAYLASGHNHYTLAMHLGTADTRLSTEIVQFVRQHAGELHGA